jgi:hypothetical protein
MRVEVEGIFVLQNTFNESKLPTIPDKQMKTVI